MTLYIHIFITGAVGLATIYHIMLFIHRRDDLLKQYCIYLSVLLLYLLYRLWLGPGSAIHRLDSLSLNYSLEATILMLTYLSYIRFWATSLLLTKADGKFIHVYYKSAFVLIPAYIIFENIALNIDTGILSDILYLAIRVYLSIAGVIAVVLALKKRRNLYYYYLAGGSIIIVVAGLFSVFVQMVLQQYFLGIRSFGWMLIGYFVDVIFFSAAIAYRLKQENIERIEALEKIVVQQRTLQAKELEALTAGFKAREAERARISSELHDDLGSGLSTIRILSTVPPTIVTPTDDHRKLEKIAGYSRELLNKMGEIVWAFNSKNDFFPATISYIRAQVAKTVEDAGLSMSFNIPDNIPNVSVSGSNRRHIFLLVKEAVHNIVKHASSAHASITIECNAYLYITILNEGGGIAPGDHYTGNGLENMRRRAVATGGSLSIDTDGCTCIRFMVPVDSLSHESVM